MQRLVDPLPNCGAFVFVEAATYGGAHQSITKAADANEIAGKLLDKDDSGIIFAQPILGEEDLLVMIRGDTPEETKERLNSRIRIHMLDKHNFVTQTSSHIISAIFGTSEFENGLTREQFKHPKEWCAWITVHLGIPDPNNLFPEQLGQVPGVKLYAPVIGNYDAFIYLETDTKAEFTKTLDDKIRRFRGFMKSSARMVV